MHTNSSETIKGKFKDTKTSFELKNKTIGEIRKENCDEDKTLRGLEFSFDPEEYHYGPKKTLDAVNNNYIQPESR